MMLLVLPSCDGEAQREAIRIAELIVRYSLLCKMSRISS